MNLRLLPTSGVPIYRQIVQQIGYGIACGRLRIGDKLPSVRELARDLPANQNTVLKAYELLERDGLIERRHGDGTYVANCGSPLNEPERLRLIGEALAEAAAKATVFGISSQRVHALLDEQLSRMAPRTSPPGDSTND